MDGLEIKVIDSKVYIGYTSLFDAHESFYEEFNLREYRQKLSEFKRNNVSEISGNNGKLKFLYRGKNLCIILSKNGEETHISEKDLSEKFFI
jgi:Tol biopolymer transport system component